VGYPKLRLLNSLDSLAVVLVVLIFRFGIMNISSAYDHTMTTRKMTALDFTKVIIL
jgi:hypothetical protein